MECQQTVEDAGFYTHYNTFTFFHTSCTCCNSHRKVTSMCFHTNAHRSLHHSHVRNDHHFNRRKQQKAAGAHEVYCITLSPMPNKKKNNLWTSFYLHEPWEEDFYQENVEYKKQHFNVVVVGYRDPSYILQCWDILWSKKKCTDDTNEKVIAISLWILWRALIHSHQLFFTALTISWCWKPFASLTVVHILPELHILKHSVRISLLNANKRSLTCRTSTWVKSYTWHAYSMMTFDLRLC